MHLFIQQIFIKHLLYPGTVLGAGNTATERQVVYPSWNLSLGGRANIKQHK